MRIHRERLTAATVLLLVAILLPGGGLVMADDPHAEAGGGEGPGAAALAGELRETVVHLADDIGERHAVGEIEALHEAEAYLRDRLEAMGYEVDRQTYTANGETVANLEVSLPGTSAGDQIVIVGAHYDTARGSPGANDNASAVAAVLALARRFSGAEPERTIRFVLFTNEEPPFFQTEGMGSYVYARRSRERGERIAGMISLDTIGYYSDEPGSQDYPIPDDSAFPDTGEFIAFLANPASAELLEKSLAAFRERADLPAEGAALPPAIPGVGWSDHWSFWQFDYPAIMLTDTAPYRYPHYHKATDTPDQVDYQAVAEVVRGMEAVVARLAGVESGR
ncbi:MAG: M28 family peptidase [Phycisphaeraceae bacterium]